MKNMLFVLLLLVGGTAYAQQAQQAKKAVGNESLLQENTTLNDLAAKVNAAQDAVAASTSGSRAQGAEAQANLKTACDAYRAELKKQIAASTSETLTAALNRELAAVNLLSPESEATPAKR